MVESILIGPCAGARVGSATVINPLPHYRFGPAMMDATGGATGTVARRSASRRWAWATLAAAVIVLASTASLLYDDVPRAAPAVEVSGGVAVDVSPDLVRVVATAPECHVRLSTRSGDDGPREVRLELVNVGAASRVTGLAGGENLVRSGRSAIASIRADGGWPRWVNASLPAPSPGNWSFIAIGDPQGHDWNIGAAGSVGAATGARFVLLLGDATASGEAHQYERVRQALEGVDSPVYATPGNHDVRTGGGGERFARLFGAGEGVFDYGGVRFVLLDTSSQAFDEHAAARLRALAGDRPNGTRLVVATHTPPLDPRQGSEDPYPGEGDGARLTAEVEGAGADLLLAGHVHMYCRTATPGGVPLVISGGGGGVMEVLDDPGAFHHVTVLGVGPDGISVQPLRLSDDPGGAPDGGVVEVLGRSGERAALDAAGLGALAALEGTWSFEDRLDNIEGTGLYRCVPVATLVGLVGGMGPGDTLVVLARDGYRQTYSHSNVFPDASWRQAQGDMALAVSLDGARAPGWEAGPRLIFTPADGLHSNADAEATTDGAFRADPFSAGSRWVREVARIEVVHG